MNSPHHSHQMLNHQNNSKCRLCQRKNHLVWTKDYQRVLRAKVWPRLRFTHRICWATAAIGLLSTSRWSHWSTRGTTATEVCQPMEARSHHSQQSEVMQASLPRCTSSREWRTSSKICREKSAATNHCSRKLTVKNQKLTLSRARGRKKKKANW